MLRVSTWRWSGARSATPRAAASPAPSACRAATSSSSTDATPRGTGGAEGDGTASPCPTAGRLAWGSLWAVPRGRGRWGRVVPLSRCPGTRGAQGVGGGTRRAHPRAGGEHSRSLGTSLEITIVLTIIKESPRFQSVRRRCVRVDVATEAPGSSGHGGPCSVISNGLPIFVSAP